MSISETISSWKQKAEIDYFALFVPLWLAFDAWFKDKYAQKTDRENLEALKMDEINNKTYKRMKNLLHGTDSMSETFKDYLVQLNQALLATPIEYEKDPGKILSFNTALVDKDTKTYENLIKGKRQHNKIKLLDDVYITNEIQKIYKAYIEILYQIRCVFFHGKLKPNKENERIIKYLYLTLKEITNEI